ncbi:MAG: hypothetical protein II951_06500 [Bacteroidales bacterium]|nr:hypothetical protein [Bacteroidales bacterium]
MKLLIKLLRQNASTWQLIVFFVAGTIGVMMLLVGMQAMRDYGRAEKAADGLLGPGTIVVSKPVSSLTTIGNLIGVRPSFSEKDIEKIASTEGVGGVGVFRSSAFNVSARVEIGGHGISTEMFLESVPDQFIDIDTERTEWGGSVGSEFIPIVIPRTYLDLYNFGFATSKGLPQVGETMLRQIPFKIGVSGNGRSRVYQTRIVGYSRKLNTILVPDQFLREANKTFGSGEEGGPSRLIIVSKGGAPSKALFELLADLGGSVDGDADELRLRSIVSGVTGVCIILGLIITLMGVSFQVVSLLLLVERNKEKTSNLRAIGYSGVEVGMPYMIVSMATAVGVSLVAAMVVSVGYPIVTDYARRVVGEFSPAGMWSVWVWAVVIAAVIVAVDWIVVRMKTEQ